MRRVFIVVLFVFSLLLVSVLFVPTQAAHATNCSSSCIAYSYWDGPTYGGATITTVSDPTLTNTNAYWARYLRMGNGTPRLFVGMVVNKGNGDGSILCNNGIHSLQYFVYVWGSSSSAHKCWTAQSSEYNQLVGLTAKPDSRCTPELDVSLEIPATNSLYEVCSTNGGSNPNLYNRMEFDEILADNPPTNQHEVWGVDWIDNGYESINGTITYQNRVVDGYSNPQPPQEFWVTDPMNGNFGGDMQSCVYQAFVFHCNIGS